MSAHVGSNVSLSRCSEIEQFLLATQWLAVGGFVLGGLVVGGLVVVDWLVAVLNGGLVVGALVGGLVWLVMDIGASDDVTS